MASAKPETTFHNGINRHLRKEVYREKTNNPYRGGMPDFYYEGNKGILWVEYKYWVSLPRSGIIESVYDLVTPRQWLWLTRANTNGVNVAVILGYKKGGRVFRIGESPLLCGQFKEDLISKADLALWIEGQVYNENKLDSAEQTSIAHPDHR